MPLYEFKCADCGHVFEELYGKSVPDGSPSARNVVRAGVKDSFRPLRQISGAGRSRHAVKGVAAPAVPAAVIPEEPDNYPP